MKDLTSYDDFIFEKKWDKPVVSSHLTEIEYDDKTKKLKVSFHDGSKYEYQEVPKKVFRNFADEQNMFGKAKKFVNKGISKITKKDLDDGTYGTRFWELIRNKNYKYKKLT